MARSRKVPPSLLILLLCLPARAARANPVEALAEWLDKDAPIAFRIDANEIEEAVDFYRRSGLPGAARTVFVASAASTAVLGFDVLTPRSWSTAGLDPAAPILGSIAALDLAAAERAVTSGGAGANHVFWRTRIALMSSDRNRAEATVRKLARLAPGMCEVNVSSAACVATAFASPAARGAAIARALQRRGVLAVGREPLFDQLVVVQLQSDVVLVDLLGAFSAAAFDWARDKRSLLRTLARKPGKKGLAARLGKGAARRLAEPGTVLWAQPEGLLSAFRARELAAVVRASPDWHPDRDALPSHDALCVDLGRTLASGAFADLALVTRLRSATGAKPRTFESRLEWGLRPGFSLAAALASKDDGLIDAKWQVDKHGAVAAGAVFTRSLASFRALPRPTLLRGNLASTLRKLRRCGGSRAALLFVFAWPQLVGQLLEEIAAIHPQAKTLVESARNTAFAVRRISTHKNALVAAAEQSFAKPADELLQGYLATVFGDVKQRKSASHSFRTWGRGPIRPYRRELAGLPVFGAGVAPRAVAWYLASPAPARRKPAGNFAELYLRPPECLRQLAQDGAGVVSDLATAILPIAAHFPRAHGTVALDGDVLRASLIWQLK